MNRWTAVVLAGSLLSGFPSAAVRGGTLNGGGGNRATGDIFVLDALGMPLVGGSASDTIRVATGVSWGLSFATPVRLLFFDLSATEDAVRLSWRGPDDGSVALFRVERAVGRLPVASSAFQVVGPPFAGTGLHCFVDHGLRAGGSYGYRLRARLRTGGDELLGPWTVTLPDGAVPGPRVSPAHPNPFRRAFAFSWRMERSGPVSWRLLDLRGAKVLEGRIVPAGPGLRSTRVAPPPDLPPGVYFLEVRTPDRHRVQKVVKLP